MVWEIGRSKALGQPEKGRAGKQRFRLPLGFQAARAGRQRNAGKPVAKGKRQRQPEKSGWVCAYGFSGCLRQTAQRQPEKPFRAMM